MAELFPNGIRAFKPNEKAPDFVKAEIVISKDDFKAWMLTEGSEIKLTLKESKKGTYYLAVNKYEKKEVTIAFVSQPEILPSGEMKTKPVKQVTLSVDDLPF